MKVCISNCISEKKSGRIKFTPLLEGLAKAQTAWFLPALLWSDYAGYACRIYRASDNAETNISYLNGLLDEQAIIDFCGASEGFLVRVNDQSGNVNDWSQSIATKCPKIYDGSAVIKVGGFPAMLSDDTATTQDNLSVSIIGSATTTAFHIYKTNKNNTGVNTGSNGALFYGLSLNGNTGTSYLNSGTPTTFVNSLSIGSTRDALHDAIINTHVITSFTSLDLSHAGWSVFNTNYHDSDSYSAPTYIQGGIIYDSPISRTDVETALNNFLSIY